MMTFNYQDILEQVDRKYFFLTKFLDESEQVELKANLQSNLQGNLFETVEVHLDGGYQNAERKRALITKENNVKLKDDFKIKAFRIDYSRKFIQINHRQVLGTMMSLGINRNTIGDIIVGDEMGTYLIVAEEITHYIVDNLTEINHTPISLVEIDISELDELKLNEPVKEDIIVPSLRLDAIVSEVLKCSRKDASDHILVKNVKINHKICEKTSQTCKINDIISVRKFGRIVLLEVKRVTKKDRIVLTIGIWR